MICVVYIGPVWSAPIDEEQLDPQFWKLSSSPPRPSPRVIHAARPEAHIANAAGASSSHARAARSPERARVIRPHKDRYHQERTPYLRNLSQLTVRPRGKPTKQEIDAYRALVYGNKSEHDERRIAEEVERRRQGYYKGQQRADERAEWERVHGLRRPPPTRLMTYQELRDLELYRDNAIYWTLVKHEEEEEKMQGRDKSKSPTPPPGDAAMSVRDGVLKYIPVWYEAKRQQIDRIMTSKGYMKRKGNKGPLYRLY